MGRRRGGRRTAVRHRDRAGATYPDYKPAPFIVASEYDGIDMVTVVTEGIFSYCGATVKIDTDRYLSHECARVRAEGEVIGHVIISEYGSQMLSLGGVNHLTGGSKKEGRVTCATLLALCNGEAVELEIEDGAAITVQAGRPWSTARPRNGCASAAARPRWECSRPNGRGWWTRWWWSTTTSPA